MFTLQGMVLKWLAEGYTLANATEPLRQAFDSSQELYHRRVATATDAQVDLGPRAVHEAFVHLRQNLAWARASSAARDERGGPRKSLARGHRYIKELDLATGPFVVFSDHHIAYRSHIQDFFARKNVGLYASVLGAYDMEGYTVVENGDVEELVIFDPLRNPGQHALLAQLAHDEAKLEAARRRVRLHELDRILEDPALAPWHEASRRLAAAGRLIRVAGNHDFDLQREEFLARFRRTIPYQEQVYDYLLLTDTQGATRKVAYAILHGHQFDHVSNPDCGARFGETISECAGMWFQGADRVWDWKLDRIASWLTPRAELFNILVTDIAGNAPEVGLPPVDPALARYRHDPWLKAIFERWFFKKNLAWEYFEHKNPITALVQEVLPGTRFAKFRHMDEELICHHLLEDFTAADRPCLVLGHSHEVRFEPFSLNHGQSCPFYVNSGAAGRFDNLVWGVEIDGPRRRVVSWNRDPETDALERRVWSPSSDGPPPAGLRPSAPAPLAHR